MLSKTALVCGPRRLSYEEIESQCNRLANGLRSAGLERWDRVAIYLDNSVEAEVAIFATLKASGVFLVANPTTKAEKTASPGERTDKDITSLDASFSPEEVLSRDSAR